MYINLYYMGMTTLVIPFFYDFKRWNMKEKVRSTLTGKDYYLSDAIRLVNIRQICSYWLMNIMPLDVYPSIDFKTNNPVLVFIYSREETQEAYKRWRESENLWEELQNEKNSVS